MKKLLFVLLPIIIWTATFTTANAQTVTSVANGNWSFSTTWDCNCIPGFSDDIVVANDVTFDVDWVQTGGSITIDSGASLVKDGSNSDLQMAGGSFTNNGTLDMHYLLLENGVVTSNTGTASIKSFANFSDLTNSGLLTNIDSFYNSSSFINTSTGIVITSTFYNDDMLDNYGSMSGIDSMTNAGLLIMRSGATLNADSATNSGTLTNDGRITWNRFTNLGTLTNNDYIGIIEMTNTGTFTNNDSLVATGSMMNLGIFDNPSGSTVMLGGSFHNGLNPPWGAIFTNNGYVQSDAGWHNFETVTGASGGSFQAADTTYNAGTMSGNFDFCDLTVPFWVTSPPYIDLNQGTIGSGITWCSPTTGIENKNMNAAFSISPNPITDEGIVHFEGDFKITEITLFNVIGQKVTTYPASGLNGLTISATDFTPGVYLLQVLSDQGEMSRKVVVR